MKARLFYTLSITACTGLLLVIVLLITGQAASAQVCSDPVNTIYGQTITGDIHPITVSTLNVGAKINSVFTGNTPYQSNAIGYNSVNGKFYFFKSNYGASPQEFMSYDPVTDLYASLSVSPITSIARSGCVNVTGTGFYCVDSSSNLCYYNIATDTWTLITSTILNHLGTNVSPSFSARKSGDMAIDGLGNLWIVISGGGFYGLYRVNAPVPTTAVASITAQELIPPSTATPISPSLSFSGIAFSATGQIYMVTTTAFNTLYRMENDLSLTLLGTLSASGVGNDLTSCNFPMSVLPVVWKKFTATPQNGRSIFLSWTTLQTEGGSTAYAVEQSGDGKTWQQTGFAPVKSPATGAESYSFTDEHPIKGENYYRIRLLMANGSISYSPVKSAAIEDESLITTWPNPVQSTLHISSKNMPGNALSHIRLTDLSGRLVSTVQPGTKKIDVGSLPPGIYLLCMQAGPGRCYYEKIIKQ